MPSRSKSRSPSLISDSIAPRLAPDIEILPWRRTQLIAAQVYPSPARPHYIKRDGADTATYVRVGSTNRRADADMIQELRRVVRGESFDERAMLDLDSEALDFRAASELFAPVRKLARNDLTTLRLLTNHQGRRVPTVGGMLLFGLDRAEHFPDAWIQVGRFAGVDKTRIADHTELRELPVLAIERAIQFIEKHSTHGPETGRVRRKERRNLPPLAVQEALINAVAHADYSQRGAPTRVSLFDDRIEIENPGLLHSGLTVEDLEHGVSKLRNRVIGRVFHALGLIEQWGSGIQRMIGACRDAGLAPPHFEEIATRFRVTIYTERVSRPSVETTDQTILDTLSDGEGRLTSEIAAVIGLTPRATRTRPARLVESGLLREVGTGPQDPKRRYFRVQ